MDTIYLIVGAVAAAIAALWGIFRQGKKSGRESTENKQYEQRTKTEGKANEASKKANDAADSSTDDANRDWLRNNARRSGD